MRPSERVYLKKNTESIKEKHGILPDEKVVIHVSNFRKVKRVKDVIRVFRNIAAKTKAKLLLVGDGPEKCVAWQLVEKYGLQDQVLLLGNQDRVEELYSISDLKLLLSEKESFGLVLLEAMACGVPCIGTNIGGIPEVIKDQVSGFLVEVGDIQEASEKALAVLEDKQLSKRLTDHALKMVETAFSSQRIVSQYERIYDELAGPE